MIVQLTGTLVEVTPSHVVLDVAGVGYELGVSSTTASSLPQVGETGVTLLTRLVTREAAMALYGFSSREERSLFDHLTAISGVGPKLALSVLSTFSAPALATVVATSDLARMSTVPGVGKKLANRLLLELQGVLAGDAELRGLVGLSDATPGGQAGGGSSEGAPGVESDVTAALLSMGFTPQEAALALEGLEDAGPISLEGAVSYALRRLGTGA